MSVYEDAETISSIICKMMEEELDRLATQAIVLHGRNPLDMDTPADVPLKVVGWGVNAAHVTYNVPGFNQLSRTEDDEFYIVTNGVNNHVVRKAQPHTRFYTHDQVSRMIQSEANDLAYEIQEMT